ncbi:hypothetical protein FALBO_12061 [Fusarium albosuccineum]|uniref:Uncharacterized protein n=1 Tax=Fusarium albosuccineum TaxID=1237068 RepID=A0A8H4L4P2_9HYPO|nr:hypothetical protein FALBO_12061 [Fusarium albosuccineum]
MISFPKLLMVTTIFHVTALGHIIPARWEASGASSIQDEAAPLLNRDESTGTDLVVRDLVSRDVDLLPSDNKELVERQWDWANNRLRRWITVGERNTFWADIPMSWTGLVAACTAFSVSHNPLTGILCVYGAMATVWNTFLLVDNVARWTGSFIEALIAPSGKRSIDGLAERVSADLGIEVRHVGFWEDTEAHQLANLKRSLPEGENRLPVLAARIRDHDFHFTYRGEVDGKALLRFGFGNGTIEDNRLGKRLEQPHFTSGGIDSLVDRVEGLQQGDWADDEPHFGMMYEQIKCAMEASSVWDTPGADAVGTFFQIYDDDGTIAVAAMSPFGEGGTSALQRMQDLPSGIQIDRMCVDRYDIFG